MGAAADATIPVEDIDLARLEDWLEEAVVAGLKEDLS